MDTCTPRARLDDRFSEPVHAAALAITFIAVCYALAMFVIGDPGSAEAISRLVSIAS